MRVSSGVAAVVTLAGALHAAIYALAETQVPTDGAARAARVSGAPLEVWRGTHLFTSRLRKPQQAQPPRPPCRPFTTSTPEEKENAPCNAQPDNQRRPRLTEVQPVYCARLPAQAASVDALGRATARMRSVLE